MDRREKLSVSAGSRSERRLREIGAEFVGEYDTVANGPGAEFLLDVTEVRRLPDRDRESEFKLSDGRVLHVEHGDGSSFDRVWLIEAKHVPIADGLVAYVRKTL
jgi:hypothetical protein